MNKKPQISKCHRNILGTISFDGAFPGMRKAEEFIVYPMQDSGSEISIQSDHRFGKIDLDTGKAILSARRDQYANYIWFSLCILRGTATKFCIDTEDRETLRQWVKSSGGIEVGSSIVKCDNTGAIAL